MNVILPCVISAISGIAIGVVGTIVFMMFTLVIRTDNSDSDTDGFHIWNGKQLIVFDEKRKPNQSYWFATVINTYGKH